MKVPLKLLQFILLFFLVSSLILPCYALEISPRQWSHLPLGMNFAGIGYANTNADIALDPVLLIEDAQMDLQTAIGRYIRAFEMFDKSVRLDVTQGYQKGKWKGLLNGVPASVRRNGLTDTFIRLAVNLYGAPPLHGKKFAAYRSSLDVETIVGLGLAVRLPTGEHLDDRLINLGENRFAVRPQIGITHKRGKWTGELTAEVAFYTDNDEFFNGKKLEQDPLLLVHGHITHTFRPGLWLGTSVGFDYGGENRVNGINKGNQRQNIGWAFSFAYPINRQSGINFVYIGARTQESTGLDSDTLAVSLSYAW